MLFYGLSPFGQVILYVILLVKPLRAGYTVCYFTALTPSGRLYCMLFYRLSPFGQVILYVILQVKPLRAGYTVCYLQVKPLRAGYTVCYFTG